MRFWLLLGIIYGSFFLWYTDLGGKLNDDEIQSDNKEPELLPINDSKIEWLAAGDLEIIELNKQLNLELPEANDHHTLAGFLLEKLQEVPSPGQTLNYKRVKFEIVSMKGPRINKVRINLSDGLFMKD